MYQRRAIYGASTLAFIGVLTSSATISFGQTPDRAELPAVVVDAAAANQKKKPKTKPDVPADAAPSAPQTIPAVEVTAERSGSPADVPPIKQKYQLPQTSASITATEIQEKINAVDAQDTIKYLPSLFVRKRNYGDNQSVLATRTSGLGASARSLIYVDDILISSLIANNNTLSVSQWGLIAPEQIKRVDFLYGPFSAAYPGNSEGGVLLFTTRMPEKFEFTIKQTEAVQTFDFYKTSRTFGTHETSVSVGDKKDRFSYFISGNYLNSDSQPLGWVTNGSVPVGTTGTVIQSGRGPGTIANVVGASGLLYIE